MKRLSNLLVAFFLALSVAAPETSASPPAGSNKPAATSGQISGVHCPRSSFNPSLGEKAELTFELGKDHTVTVCVFDPDNGLVRTIVDKVPLKAGPQTVSWDGKDSDGAVVPDEAYYFTIATEASGGSSEVYDPTTFSGGESKDILDADFRPESESLVYRMPELGRVNIRIGLQGGPLLKTLVDWKPKPPGEITERWNGMDDDNLIDIASRGDAKMVTTYFTLPENSVIAYGNKSVDYRDYKRSEQVKKRPSKAERPRTVKPKSPISPHYTRPRSEDYAPKIQVSLPNVRDHAEDGSPILRGRTLVRVELGASESFLMEERYEISFFLDGKFHAEDEAGYTPYNWVWDVSEVPEGEHILTVNLASFKDQIGVRSLKVKVAR